METSSNHFDLKELSSFASQYKSHFANKWFKEWASEVLYSSMKQADDQTSDEKYHYGANIGCTWGGGRAHNAIDSILALHPVAPGSIPGIPKNFSEE